MWLVRRLAAVACGWAPRLEAVFWVAKPQVVQRLVVQRLAAMLLEAGTSEAEMSVATQLSCPVSTVGLILASGVEWLQLPESEFAPNIRLQQFALPHRSSVHPKHSMLLAEYGRLAEFVGQAGLQVQLQVERYSLPLQGYALAGRLRLHWLPSCDVTKSDLPRGETHRHSLAGAPDRRIQNSQTQDQDRRELAFDRRDSRLGWCRRLRPELRLVDKLACPSLVKMCCWSRAVSHS